MLKAVKTLFSRFLKAPVRNARELYLDGFSIKSYSQEGEDMILRRLFENQRTGFYVDVGAHHPFRFSNTYFFYKMGWHGINLDAMPGSMASFKRFRGRDINLEIPVSDREEILTYYMFNEPALNSFSKELSESRQKINPNYFIREELKLQTRRLSDILTAHLPPDTTIDFLSVDVEGHDFEVLRSNDWDKYRPGAVLVEILGSTLEDIDRQEICLYLKRQGYLIFAKSLYTVIFLRSDIHETKFMQSKSSDTGGKPAPETR